MAIVSERMSQETVREYTIEYSIERQAANWWLKTGDASVKEKHAADRIPHSDLNAAREIYAALKNRVHYVPGANAWHVWNGVFHERIDGDLLAHWMCTAFVDEHRRTLDEVKEHFVAIASTLSGQAREAKMKEYTKDIFGPHREYKKKIHMNTGISGLITQIKALFSVVDSFFDDDRQWLVLDNGVIDLDELRVNPPIPGNLAGIKLLEHDPARPVSRQVGAALNPKATAPRWMHFLSSSLPDGELRKFLAVVTGAALLAESKTKIVPVLQGPRDSGKTIYISTIDTLVGGYGGQPDVSALNMVNGQNFEQDSFRGLRFVGMSEPHPNRKVDESFVKKFTGGDVMTTRNLHARSVEWLSQGVLFIATNTDLKFNSNDKAILTRFATVRFPHQFWSKGQVPKGEEEFVKDMSLEKDLLLEGEGILSWVMNGMLTYLQDGVVIPESIEQDRAKRYVEGSSVHVWLEDFIKQGFDRFVVSEVAPSKLTHYAEYDEVYMAYVGWCAVDYGEDPLKKLAFGKELREYLGITENVRSGVVRVPKLVYKHCMVDANAPTDNY